MELEQQQQQQQLLQNQQQQQLLVNIAPQLQKNVNTDLTGMVLKVFPYFFIFRDHLLIFSPNLYELVK